MQRSLLKGIKNCRLETDQPYTFSVRNKKTDSVIQRNQINENAQPKKVVSQTALVTEFARCSSSSEMVIYEASRLHNSGIKPNGYGLVCLIKASARLGWVSYGQQLHCYAIHSGFGANIFVSTTLINFYMHYDLFREAHRMFDEIPQPSIVSWNAIISGYVQSGQYDKALSLVLELETSELQADAFTYTTILTASGQSNYLDFGSSIHSRIVKSGLECNVVVGNCLIDMYGKCGSAEDASQVFHEMVDKDTVSWNSVIGANSRNRRLKAAFGFLHQTPVPDTISYNEVINGISQFGNIEDAVKILSNMPTPNSSSWNSIISGYICRDQPQEALDFFYKMHSRGIEMDQFTLSSILSGVAGLSALTWGSLIHGCAIKSGLDTYIVVGSALIDMYSKCGQITVAESIFHSLPRWNLIIWNTMMAGYAQNGRTYKAIGLFEQLKQSGDLEPDGLTFLSILSVCCRDGGLYHLGIQYFKSMINDFGIDPMAEHCSCMIHLLGQKGELWKADRMIFEMGFGSCGLLWKVLLGACGDLKVAEIAAAKVIELGGDDEFVYVLLSNLYASHGRWREVSAIRELMRKRGLRKEAGCSWIDY